MAKSSLDIRPKDKPEGKKILIFAVLFVVLIGASWLVSRNKGASAGKIDFDLYVMSQCPYGTEAEALVLEVMDSFEDDVNFNVEYIATVNPDGTISSLHGAPEVEGNIYQLCVKNSHPDKFWDYIECQNKNMSDLSGSFESCANEVGVDYSTIKSCADGDEGKDLLTASATKATELQVSGSPTFYIDGEKLNLGARSEVALKRAICDATDREPKACGDIPEDKEFTAYILRDSRCTTDMCGTEQLEEQLNGTFSKISYKELDYNTDEGREFYDEYGLTLLPAVLFTKDVEGTDNYAQIQRYLVESNDLYSLAIGASYNPSREEESGRLDLFVMSLCPYGTKAMDVMEEVLANFGDSMDFNLNFIANENEDGTFDALHGQPEVDENIRELCAAEYYPNSYMDYVWCRNDNLNDDWTKCAGNFSAIRGCFQGSTGKNLHSKNIELANELGIGASPTWMVNNKYSFRGIDAETVRANFCKFNDAPGCENTLTGQAAAPSGGAPAGGSCN